jgi:hypothetical protein
MWRAFKRIHAVGNGILEDVGLCVKPEDICAITTYIRNPRWSRIQDCLGAWRRIRIIGPLVE